MVAICIRSTGTAAVPAIPAIPPVPGTPATIQKTPGINPFTGLPYTTRLVHVEEEITLYVCCSTHIPLNLNIFTITESYCLTDTMNCIGNVFSYLCLSTGKNL